MKLWFDFGSEHSMNLVMIGHFEDGSVAEQTRQVLTLFKERVELAIKAGRIGVNEPVAKFDDDMMSLLKETKIWTLGQNELEQFAYDVRVERNDKDIVITTDEADVSAFLKVLLNNGAKVEVYSAHDHQGTGHGR